MAKKVKVKLNRAGVRNLLKSEEMMQICKDHAYATQAALGAGYEVTYRSGKNRANAEVAAVSRKARKENSKDNIILKVLR